MGKAYSLDLRERIIGFIDRVPRRGVEVQRDVELSAGCLVQAIAELAGRLSRGLSLIGASDSRLM